MAAGMNWFAENQHTINVDLLTQNVAGNFFSFNKLWNIEPIWRSDPVATKLAMWTAHYTQEALHTEVHRLHGNYTVQSFHRQLQRRLMQLLLQQLQFILQQLHEQSSCGNFAAATVASCIHCRIGRSVRKSHSA